LLVEFHDGSLGIRPKLSRSCTKGIGCLQGMASLNPALALTAVTDMNVELTVDGFAWDLHLKLLSDVGFIKWAATIGAAVRHRCLVNLVDLIRGRRWRWALVP
jgi:hypothetical protein